MTDDRTRGGRSAWTAAEQRTAVFDAVFAGLNHALSNRVMGLHSFLLIAERRGTADWGALTAEHARCDRLLQLYRLLEASPWERPEPMLVSEPTADASDLLGHHLELREIRIETQAAPESAVVSLPRRGAALAFLVLLYEAARRADRDQPWVAWRYSMDAGSVTVTAESCPAAEADDDAAGLAEAAVRIGASPDAASSRLDPRHAYIAALRIPLLHSRLGS